MEEILINASVGAILGGGIYWYASWNKKKRDLQKAERLIKEQEQEIAERLFGRDESPFNESRDKHKKLWE
tara:strand:+ start:147 stop:356 length:210 start_codon:yes stop_codon:yes gene_type:complete